MSNSHYIMYHNPDTMGCGCDHPEMRGSGIVATNKESVANQIAADGDAVIWCVGRTDIEGDEDNFYLYQRIDLPTVEEGDEDFSVHLVGTPRVPSGKRTNITDRAYFPKIEKLLRFGVQPIYDQELIASLEKEFATLCRK